MNKWGQTPLICLSAGFSVVEIEGPVNNTLSGTVFGYGAGLTFRFSNRVGLTFAYSQLDSQSEDSGGNKFDISGSNFSANVSISFKSI